MALVLQDRVRELSNSSGTGNITLAGAFDGFRTFDSCVPTGSTVYYTIRNTTVPNNTEWEVGVGTFTSPATLSRDTVLSSSNSGSLVNFSTSSDLEVFITQPSEKALYVNASNVVEAYGNGANSITFTNVNLTTGTITANAANATDIVNKGYVDTIVAAGVHYHDPVFVESPTALVAVYNQPNGAGNGVGATLTNSGANVALVIDGVSVSNTARVLVYQQANAVQNGIYTVTNPGAPDPGGAQWVLTRATDADTYVVASSAGLSEGSTVYVQSGNTGAGEVYTCNTQGVITFGTTNITFAQIGSAQIYSAGTGLSLTNTTFSIANTAVTAATYGNASAVGQFTVNAQGQITNAANTTISISSSQINDAIPNSGLANSNVVVNGTTINLGGSGTITANTTGTLTIGSYLSGGSFNGSANVTIAVEGNSSNSANTVVVRDADGNFGSNVITASSFSGNGVALTAINASNISTGTIANARTTAASANGASTIVLRDASGSFEANTVNASAFVGNGVQITAINASNLTTGTVDNARTTASSANGASTIVLRDVNGSFSANVVNADSFSGNGTAITAINASNISSGTIGSAYVSGAYGNVTGVGTLTSGTWQANVVSPTYGGTGSANLAADNVILGNGASAVKVVAPGTAGNVLTSNGSTWTSQAVVSTISVTDSNSANTTFYPTMTANSSGSISGVNVASQVFSANPSLNEVKAPVFLSNNGVIVHSTIVSSNYTIAANCNGFSVGPITTANGATITLTSGQRWVII